MYLSLTVLCLHCCARIFPSCRERELLLWWRYSDLSLQWLFSLLSTGSRLGRLQAQQLWCTGLDAQPHVGSFLTRDRTHVSLTGRQTLYH